VLEDAADVGALGLGHVDVGEDEVRRQPFSVASNSASVEVARTS
jgi:hypothetical protein